ncbi:M1 family metallopeptidase [soil metagenome]
MGNRWRIGATLLIVCGGFEVLSVSARGQNEEGSRPAPARLGRPSETVDVHSFGNPWEVLVRRVELDLVVDFENRQLEGTADLLIERSPESPVEAPLVLDTRDLIILEIRSVEGPEDQGQRIAYSMGPEALEIPEAERPLYPTGIRNDGAPIHGVPLRIDLPAGADRVRVAYRTSPTATALQWLDPEQTAGGRRPFLFTQSQAIHARSWIPLQDSPGVRVTYSARIRVPEGLKAVMSAEGNFQAEEAAGEFRFEMPQPIPPYLIALAVGDLAFRPIGPRTGVYAEPAVIDRAAFEFEDTERMIEVTEARFGPYRWGRYDILVLPPSFPFGGMENPRLTFATPTILAGDRSLVSLIAHELAHSWSGNLVSNATWRDFWLNEGFTTYLEGRIIEDMFGPDRASMESLLGLRELREDLENLEESDQILHIDLKGRDPDEGVTRIPYEKGKFFLTALEQALGRASFDVFLRGYFDHFAFQSITTAQFEEYLRANAPEVLAAVDLEAWLREPGLPEFEAPVSDRLDAVERQADDWLAGDVDAAGLLTDDWSTQEWLHFLRALPEDLTADRLAELDEVYLLTEIGNAEIAAQWLRMAIRANYAPANARLEDFLSNVGRRKFLMPLYQELARTPEGLVVARRIYAEARPLYHPIAVESVDQLLEHP